MNRGTQAAFFATLLLALTVRTVSADNAQPPGTPTANTAQTLISQLDNPDFKIRSAASLQLNNLPGDAFPAVEAAIKGGTLSPESQLRLETALKYLKPRNFYETRQKQCTDWENRLLHEAYHQSGQTDPKYDQAVDDAIDQFRDLRYEPKMQERDPAREKVLAAFKLATTNGCDDPYIRCLYVACAGNSAANRLLVSFHSPVPILLKFLDGKYHPAVKLIVIYRYFPCVGADKRELMKRLPGLIDQLCADAQVPQTEPYELLLNLANAFSRFSPGSQYTFEPILAEYLKLKPNQTDSTVLKAYYEYVKAFEARGRADQVPPDRQKAFLDGLAQSEKTLQAAWDADPKDFRAPTMMISIKQAQGQAGGGRESMELWFKRAIEINPDNGDAYQRKFDYLRSREGWEAVIAFGHECLATQNWRAGLPYILSNAHEIYSSGNPKYMSQGDNWKDMEDVYEGSFLSFPNDLAHRNHYVYLALVARKYDVATRQIQLLGDKSQWYYDPAERSWGDAAYRREHPKTATRPTTKPVKQQ